MASLLYTYSPCTTILTRVLIVVAYINLVHFHFVQSYNYFAIGSNMASSTMTNLRNLNPIASTPAILKDHRLAFNVPGTPLIEPSWASVEPEKGCIVHGVLYKLTEEDFQTICQTEGVPFAYGLHRCNVLPYVGNGVDAGKQKWLLEGDGRGCGDESDHDDSKNETENKEQQIIQAFTLRAGRKSWRNSKDIAPSRSYMNVLIRGAKEFQLDEDYVRSLEAIQCSKMMIGDGIAEMMLQFAELRN